MPLITGTGLSASTRARASSLKDHKSSIAPPPRTSKMTSIGTVFLESSTLAPVPASTSALRWASAYKVCNACASSLAAWAPCTLAGAISTGMCGTRLSKALTTSCKAAAPSEVTTPMPRIRLGSAFLRSASNKPSACKRALSSTNCSYKLPSPASTMASTTSCNSPRGSYTPRRPDTSTRCPSRGAKAKPVAARLNMAQRNCPPLSLSEK